MGQVVSNRTGRIKIFHSGINPEIVIKAVQKKEHLLFRAELKLDQNINLTAITQLLYRLMRKMVLQKNL